MSSLDTTSRALVNSMWLQWFASGKNLAREHLAREEQGTLIGKAVVIVGRGNSVPKLRDWSICLIMKG